MSKCSLRIELDRHDAIYQIGDTVNCTVHVTVNKNVKCKALTLKKYWKTHGRGNRDSGGESEEILFSGEWQSGEYQYPYSFVVNKGPLTYHGNLINIDWYLQARADIPWALDPKAETEFLLERNENVATDVDEDELELGPQLKNPVNLSNLPGWVVAIPLIFVLIGGGLFYNGWYSDSDIGSAVIGVAFCVFGLIGTFKLLKRSIAARKLGEVKLQLEPRNLRPQDTVRIVLSFTPKSNVMLNKMIATLGAEEVAVSGSGTNRTTHRHNIHESTVHFQRKGEIYIGNSVYEQVSLEMPANAAPSFSGGDNDIKWSVTVHIDIENWPDWSIAESINVLV